MSSNAPDLEEGMTLELVRCGSCRSQNLTLYPADEAHALPLMAVCRTCGAHYHEGMGWVDAEDL